MTVVLQTKSSALILHDIDAEICELIKTCVEAVDTELDLNMEMYATSIVASVFIQIHQRVIITAHRKL
jgi:hypothetical protein